MKREIVIILHNIRSAYNVGAIFRTADATGVSRMYLSGYTPTPLDRFGKKRKDVAKSALGAEEYLPWEHHTKIDYVIKRLKRDGFSIVAVEQGVGAINYRSHKLHKKTAFLFGNEVRGLSQALLRKIDTVIEIPMRGKKESLNVSVAVGVVLFGVS
ncbi:MAG: RNA methyltransferase [Candidatus Yonathbacteria bacterium CG_4_10_14_3_um_filter_47_65]|uniref:RNA methyltransferase n=2 Tax=Parcubacteria group TaxID=1794811 RepID=A0A2M8D5L5_9BACT|nr:MAG: hypothetical protein AUJ44_01485 [Candidatus Nomurabacteria bacterium CG1_02_47_685]PIP03419.1 MAG: RNA methyltransferase [Candidatus Yonathbacteria bacterium CG23_combo_of_CG06-09_8_20_14_all_46_18]PIQ32270.1 MAG: RNA methyltransferase [Candidatus Yonathbacteria bacterium CG17_big_fil_post_rev_8_21_14_2_50_46_19]PIX56069.1 MAG: RNA methyltransferase [Candidatus Yonathbacteria bacterium CG_4_10_14_3_um_filter_47_65]PIY57579.1 MAG: RNA methyltransferase [Candidatus Yonathbacteria bacteri